MKFLVKRIKNLTLVLIISIFFQFILEPVHFIHVSSASKYIASECELKAAFLYQFTKFVNWPTSDGDSEVNNISDNATDKLVIGVMAYGDMLNALMALDGKKSQDRVIVIKQLDDIPEDDNINVVFLQKDYPCDKEELVDYAIKNHILTISDEADALEEGIIIVIYQIDSRIRFDINLKIAKKSKLVLSSKLLRLARRVVR